MNEKILVVDDEKAITDLIGMYLKGDGYRVFPCGSGSEALSILDREDISLAVLDVMLPGMDGFTLCEKIRSRFLFPIILRLPAGEI